MLHFFGLVALAAFMASLIGHLFSIAGVDVVAYVPQFYYLFGLIFILFPVAAFLAYQSRKASAAAEHRATYPQWLHFAMRGVLVYVMINFAIGWFGALEGTAAVQGGKYILQNHGELVRELSLTEYTAYQARDVRMMSGHMMFFYFAFFTEYLKRRLTLAPAAEV